MSIAGKEGRALVDSGSEVNAVSKAVCAEAGVEISSTHRVVQGLGHESIRAAGKVVVPLKVGEQV